MVYFVKMIHWNRSGFFERLYSEAVLNFMKMTQWDSFRLYKDDIVKQYWTVCETQAAPLKPKHQQSDGRTAEEKQDERKKTMMEEEVELEEEPTGIIQLSVV